MSDHITRMKQEHIELGDKIYKLEVFIGDKKSVFHTLDKVDQNLMVEQLAAMKKYADILDTRIVRATK